MRNKYKKGVAFICEGDTEKEFYLSLLAFFCDKHHKSIVKTVNEQEPDIVYELRGSDDDILVIKFFIAESITGMPRSSKWFEVECVKKYGSRIPWTAYLCYDTDAYTKDVTQFYEGDWKDLRNKLKRAVDIVDLAAAADIEDILLVDIEGVCNFIQHPIVDIADLPGRKGATKMKQLYRECGKSYHKGKRARMMIDSLDKQKIVDSDIVPLKKVEALFIE